MERLKAKDYDVVPDELTFEMEDQLGVFDIHPETGFYNLTFYTVESPSSDMGAILYFFLPVSYTHLTLPTIYSV